MRLEELLRADSPLWRTLPDFPRIPIEKIGLYTDEYRTTLHDVPRDGTATSGAGFDSQTDVKATKQRAGH